MGTRADFYVGKGADAEWIGSVAYDGYEWIQRLKDEADDAINSAKTEDEYRDAVASVLVSRNDGTTPEMGWPWPWDNSCTTDYAYCFVGDCLEVFNWGCTCDSDEKQEWPDFSDVVHSAKAGSSRSGNILVVGL